MWRAVWKRCFRPIAWAALAATLLTEPGLAEVMPQVSAFAEQQPGAPAVLSIVILDGDEALNNIRDRTAREPIVQVQDENHKPVAGVLLLFTIHGSTSGASGTVNGISSFQAVTDESGKAVMKGLQNNGIAGSYSIEVQATLGTITSTVTIHESNVAPPATASESISSPSRPGFASRHEKLLVGAAAAALAVSLFFGIRKRSTDITAGAGSVHP